MNILLVAATHREVDPLLKKWKLIRDNRNANIYSFRFGQTQGKLLITGPGIAATTYSLTKILTKSRYDFAVNIGVCGSFRKQFSIGTVIRVWQDCFADFGAEVRGAFKSAKEIGLAPTITYRSTSIFHPYLNKLPTAKGITVNTVHGHWPSIHRVRKKFNPDIETMEGAAFFYVCKAEQLPATQIRAVSNYVEERNKKNWNISLAVKNLSILITNIIEGP